MVTSPDDGQPISNDSSQSNRASRPRNQENAATGGSAAAVRAVSIQFIRFYFRAPVKAFFRTRVDYLGYARAINPRIAADKTWSLRLSTPAILAHAVKEEGWSFIPKHILPPMLANMAVGAVLYTSYLQILGALYEPASHSSKRIYPPPPMTATFAAGVAAGTIQSIFAAPLDALQARFSAKQMLDGQYSSIMDYAKRKLREIGLRGMFAGWTLSFTKDSLGYGLFFATFETIKSQGYYQFVIRYYGNINPYSQTEMKKPNWVDDGRGRPTLRPHYAVEPTFLLIAGVGASVTQQFIQHPLSAIQNVYYERIESIDMVVKTAPRNLARAQVMQSYYRAYQKTFAECQKKVQKVGSWRSWLYRGFLFHTVRQVPSTSAGLVVFEMVRRRYAWDDESVVIEKDGYDILLS